MRGLAKKYRALKTTIKNRWRPKGKIDPGIIKFDSVQLIFANLSPLLHQVQEKYQIGDSIPRGQSQTENDWARNDYIESRILPGHSYLDAGIGYSILINAVALSGKFQKIVGIDIKLWKVPFKVAPHELKKMSVTNLEFEDKSFDTIVCVEVLEHLEKDDFLKALSELRRVCRKQLLMTVPFEETRISKHHKQNFFQEDLKHYFPKAKFTLLKKMGHPKIHWMLIEEKFNPTAA